MYKLLIVDDEAIERDAVKFILEKKVNWNLMPSKKPPMDRKPYRLQQFLSQILL